MSSSSKRIFAVTIPLFAFFFISLAVFKLMETPNCHDTPAAQVNIVFDKTKGYSPTQAHSIDRTLVELLQRAADNTEINLYYVTSNGDRPHLVLNECKPTTRTNPLLGDPQQQQRNFRRLVIKRLKEKIDLHYGALAPAPLVESLATISRETIFTSKIEQHVRVEFDIFSDMVQDSKNASLARPPPRNGSGRKAIDPKYCTSSFAARSVGFNDLYTDVKQVFRDVPVNVYGIYRDPTGWPRYPGERCLRTFWEGTFPHVTWTTL
jgi:hypothetical protein